MAQTNAERQRRWVERLKIKATGATPEMIHKAARLSYGRWAVAKEGQPSWPELLHQRPSEWRNFIPDRVDHDYAEFGSDSELMRAVARVMHAINHPPRA